jgi:hypothetical protein
MSFENALIIQSDRSVLLDVHSPHAEDARIAIVPFAELVKSPEHIHTYQISPLSVWNVRAAGMPVEDMIAALVTHAKYPMPDLVAQELQTLGDRYGLTVIKSHKEKLILHIADVPLAEQLSRNEAVEKYLGDRLSDVTFLIDEGDRLYEEFRSGAIGGLVLSRVGNFALDLPDADVLIQVSGKYGSRQEVRKINKLGTLDSTRNWISITAN